MAKSNQVCDIPSLDLGKKHIALALQGGGSHGAFTWGVLDEFLREDSIEIEAISGTSAGSMNGAIAAYGIEHGGESKAQELLERFWQAVARCNALSPFQPTMLDRMMGNDNLDYSMGFMAFDFMSRLLSPYQLNPLGLNPLKAILLDLIDFEELRTCHRMKLFISATNVRSGALKVFQHPKITVDSLLASSCLPFLFKAVEIEGQHYWDGGYMGNPTLYPLLHRCQTPDIVIVQINPLNREDVPMTASSILDRVNEISFNSSLVHELRSLAIINTLVREKKVDDKLGLRRLHLHMVQDEELMSQLSYASKLNADYDFLLMLREAGRKAAREWLNAHYDKIGEHSSFDVARLPVESE
jgi:NTE family protein